MGLGTPAAPRGIGEMPSTSSLGHRITRVTAGLSSPKQTPCSPCSQQPPLPQRKKKRKSKAFLKTSPSFSSLLFKDL